MGGTVLVIQAGERGESAARAALAALAEFDVPGSVVAAGSDARVEEIPTLQAAPIVIVVAAGPGLAGAISRAKACPVIAVPPGDPGGLAALRQAASADPEAPVAVVAIDNGRNAGLLAVRMLAAHDGELRARVEAWQERLAASVREKDETVRTRFAGAAGRSNTAGAEGSPASSGPAA